MTDTTEMPMQHLVPAAGLNVRDPATGEPLPAEGRAVRIDSYWLRRLRDGDVAAAKPAPKKGEK